MLRLAARRLPSLARRAVSGSSEFHPLSLRRRHALDSEGLLPPLYNNLDLRWRTGFGSGFLRRFSSVNHRDDIDEAALEEEAEKKMGWLLKLIFIATGSLVAFQFFPYMGDNLLQQSISLLLVKDPLFKRMGASRLARFAVDDERRMKVVEMGGAQKLLDMLEVAKDDKTRKYALKALVALSHSDAAAEVLHQAGAAPIVSCTPDSVEYSEIGTYKSSLLKRFEDLKREAGVN
ncbi:Armadillo-like helical-containing protein [Dioscorea alata]|uniref:Armadillo-like helical-containing protein n=1 Tax=Dioscorea alata TaxID=55571 RepID=A0ACB7VM36_DIOAL|nr:Armadillo-like helical-containing protein [Dioscorea alata]